MGTEYHYHGQAPRTAYEAAGLLVAEGRHVHLSAEGESVCYSGHCPPDRLAAACLAGAVLR